MRLRLGLLFLVVCGALSSAVLPAARAQQEQSENHRKVISRVTPLYPSLAQKIGISGSVKMRRSLRRMGQ
jgi:hypothetical protein